MSQGENAAETSAATVNKSTDPAASTTTGAATAAATDSTPVGAATDSVGVTNNSAGQSPTAGLTSNTSPVSTAEKLATADASNATNAANATASSDISAGEKGKEKESETPKSPPRQDAPPSPPPTHDGRSTSPPPRREDGSSSGATATFEANQIEKAPGNEGGPSNYHDMLPNAIEPSEFLLTGLNRDVIEKEVLSRGINDTKEETLACLLRAGCIFAHAFDNFSASIAEIERLKAESAQHQEAAAAWEKRFDKLATQAGKDKVYADKLIGTAGIKIGELQDQLALMREEADDLDASLQACKKEKEQAEKDLMAKESELATLHAELAEHEKKSAESLASAKADLEAAMRTASEEMKKAGEVHNAALAAKDSDIASYLAKIKELENDLAMEKAKAAEAREQAADIAYDNRERGFYLAKDQAQHLFPNLDFSAMGVMKEITAEGLVGPDDPPLIDQNLWTATEEEEEAGEEERNND